MKPLILLALLVGFCSSVKAQADQKEIAAVTKAVSDYLDGGTFGDSLQFSRAFYPQGQMLFMRNDTLRIISLKDFTANQKNTHQKTNRKTKVDNIQVYGNAAQAKLTVEYDTFFFHDMMSLLKTEEGWKIVAKVFYREDKQVAK